MNVFNWFVTVIFLVQALAFLIGFGPFENNIIEKDFLPKNSVLKPLSIAGILLAIILFLSMSVGMSMKSCGSNRSKNVLLTNI